MVPRVAASGYSRVTVHSESESLHSAGWLVVVPRWVLSSDSPLAASALCPLAGSGTPLGTTLKWTRPITDLTILLVVTIDELARSPSRYGSGSAGDSELLAWLPIVTARGHATLPR